MQTYNQIYINHSVCLCVLPSLQLWLYWDKDATTVCGVMLVLVVPEIRLGGKGLNKYLFRVEGSVSCVGIVEPLMVWVSVCPQRHDHCEKNQHAITCQQCLAPLWSATRMFQRCRGNVPSLLNWCKWKHEAACYSKFIFVIECLTLSYSHKEQQKNPW